MVRKYKKLVGTRNYKNYSDEKVEEALSNIVSSSMTIRKASQQFKIPFGTLYNKYKGLHSRNVGRPTILSFKEEKHLIKLAVTCGDWGYPLGKDDVRYLAKSMLDSQGRSVLRLKDNKPGIDWVDGLLLRHKTDICRRLAANIKKARASVSIQSLSSYFQNLKITIENVPPTHIFNYDETNFADEPGKKFKLYRRGVKYPEQICNFSKSATTVMVCGSASGTLLPPYIIFKSSKMWDTWTQNGPKGYPACQERCCSLGSRYNRTDHGWMEASTFTDWFETCFLPHAKRLPGRKILIGDNLAAHFTDSVIKLCEENEVSFVCLVPNSTHLTQPLDVCFFRPMKGVWRDILNDWKQSNPRLTAIPKEKFPALLQKTLEALDKKHGLISNNLKSGFEATGIYPWNSERVLEKIPGYTPSPNREEMNSTLVNFLKEQRFGNDNVNIKKVKKKLLKVEPGKSITSATILQKEVSRLDDLPNKSSNEPEENTNQTFQVEDYILVNIKATNTDVNKTYAAKIMELLQPDLYYVKFLRLKPGKKIIIVFFLKLKTVAIYPKVKLN